MTIRQRITLLLIFMFIAITVIGGCGIYQSRRGAIEVKRVTEGVVPSALASADMVSHLKDVQLATMALVFTPDNELVNQLKEKLDAKRSELTAAVKDQAAHAEGKTQQGLIEQAQESMSNYFSAINDSISMKLAGKNELSQANLFANVVQYQDELGQIVETLRIEKNREKDQAISALNENLASTTTTITTITAAAGILLTIIGVFLYRQIVGPLGRMQGTMSEIASSQDFARRVPVDRMDEVGHSIVAFNGMLEKIEESSAQVRQKTADIEAMLQNIQQGILTVVGDAVVHPEYSAHLETVLETNNIAGCDVMRLVFSDTDLGADALSQVDAAIRACLGEDELNFEFNHHLLPSEIQKTMPDGRIKALDLSWSPISDSGGIIVRLMLCLRDVTELRKLAAEADAQKHKLEIIGEILAVTQEKFQEFIDSSMEFVRRNVQLADVTEYGDDAVIDELFRNMHTVKGNARTYGLRHLTNVVHEVEQAYEALRQPDTDVAWDRQQLSNDLTRVTQALAEYAQMNEETLGRKGPGRRGSVERYLMVEKAQIHNSLTLLEQADPGSVESLSHMRLTVHRELRLLGSETIDAMLSGVLDSLPSLAFELGKEPPMVHINDYGYRVHSQAGNVLKNVFMHLLRNSLDHGIENTATRSAMNKPAAGNINIELGVDEDMLEITLTDDGRGLALSRIRAIAIEKGLIAADASLSDEDIAHLIFRPGFSTAQQLTEVSGRGVGMDAVKDFLEREQGKIQLRFTDEDVGADFRQFETIVFLPDRYAVDTVSPLPGVALEGMPMDSVVTKNFI
ncbi:ATP-binding protein [Noviherbaspirillum pedocola]|uniref:Chemotaxis protein CheA n=1 Tax=Noviherbaspirillum pedocola TaxID=2801341 RepID=A0A934T1G3_9BURK|nr:ATP-binding protein [Noviherbaspirillum pedocola]MBK4737252.1 HAMP domain-containing protein [Noviherbaspirillum pedocola]